MNNFAKFYFLLAVAMLSACRSHKAIEESVYVASDSCKTETTLNVQSLTNIAATESADANYRQEHFDFEEGAGVIQIHPDGAVTIKGLKSTVLTRKSKHQTTDIQISESDTLSTETHSESSSAMESEVKTKKDTPASNSNGLKHLFLLITILLVIVFFLKHLKDKLKL